MKLSRTFKTKKLTSYSYGSMSKYVSENLIGTGEMNFLGAVTRVSLLEHKQWKI